jgi:hypothetical protein
MSTYVCNVEKRISNLLWMLCPVRVGKRVCVLIPLSVQLDKYRAHLTTDDLAELELNHKLKCNGLLQGTTKPE